MPRTEVQTRILYQFDELSDGAKERARNWWRNIIASDADWSEHVISDAADIADILGIDLRQRRVSLMGGGTRMKPLIYWSLDRDGGVGFDATYSYVAGSVAKIKQHAPQDTELHAIATTLQRAQRPHFYRLTANVSTTGRDGLSLRIDVYCDAHDDSHESDTDNGSALDVADAIRDFAHWIHSALVREYDSRMADEQVDDDIRANEYEFEEEGERA